MPQVRRVPVSAPPARPSVDLTDPAVTGVYGAEGMDGSHIGVPVADPLVAVAKQAKLETEQAQQTSQPAAAQPAAAQQAAAQPVIDETPPISNSDLLKMVQALIDGTASPNPLNGFWQVAYHWRLFIVLDQDLYNTQKPASISDLYTKIDTLPQITIAETAATTYNIKSVETRAVVGPSFEARNANIFQFTLEIVEPISVGFLDALKQSALNLRVKNLNKCPYMLELSFRAYDDNGALVHDPLAGQPNGQVESSRWMWQIQITNIDTHFDSSGGQYTLTAQVYNDGAVDADTLSVPQTATIRGSTIGQMLDSLSTAMTKSWKTRYNDDLVTYKFKMHKITNPPPAVSDPDPNNYQMRPQNPDFNSVRMLPLNPRSSSEIQAQLSPGTSYTDVVQWMMMNNDHTQKLGLDKDNTNLGSLIDRIETDIEITGYDEVSANYKKIAHIHIWPYYTQAILTGPEQRDAAKSSDVQMKMVKTLLQRRFLSKHYDYLYTGLNTEVLEFDIRASFQWNALLPNMSGAHAGVDNLEQALRFPATSQQHATDAASFKQKRASIEANNSQISQAIGAVVDASAALDPQKNDLQKRSDQALDVWRTSNSATDKAAALQTYNELQPKLADLTAKQAAYADTSIALHKRIDENMQSLEADRAALTGNKPPPNYAEDLLQPDGTAINNDPNFQYEYFNYAISFRQGYLDARSQAGTGFVGARHRDKSTFGALIDQLYQPETVQLANIEITVRGDPYWLGASNLNRQVLLRKDDPKAGSETAFNNLPNWIVGDQTMLLTFRYPILIGENGQPVFKTDDTFNGIYRVYEVTSTFADGVFKQKLKGQVIPLINIATAFNQIGARTALTSDGASAGSSGGSGGDGGGSSGPVTPALTRADQQANAKKFRDALKAEAQSKGITLSDANIDGIVANAYRESSMNPASHAIDSNGKPSAGLLQWNGPRNTAFANYTGVTPQNATIEQQAAYTVHELATSERGTLNALQTATTPDASQHVWVVNYERPHDPTAGAATNRRFLPNLYGNTAS